MGHCCDYIIRRYHFSNILLTFQCYLRCSQFFESIRSATFRKITVYSCSYGNAASISSQLCFIKLNTVLILQHFSCAFTAIPDSICPNVSICSIFQKCSCTSRYLLVQFLSDGITYSCKSNSFLIPGIGDHRIGNLWNGNNHISFFGLSILIYRTIWFCADLRITHYSLVICNIKTFHRGVHISS